MFLLLDVLTVLLRLPDLLLPDILLSELFDGPPRRLETLLAGLFKRTGGGIIGAFVLGLLIGLAGCGLLTPELVLRSGSGGGGVLLEDGERSGNGGGLISTGLSVIKSFRLYDIFSVDGFKSTVMSILRERELIKYKKSELLDILSNLREDISENLTKDALIDMIINLEQPKSAADQLSTSSDDTDKDSYHSRPLSNNNSKHNTRTSTRAAKKKALNKLSLESINKPSVQARYQLRTRTVSNETTPNSVDNAVNSVSMMNLDEPESSFNEDEIDLQEETASTLKRYLKRQLEHLCDVNDIDYSKTNTKDELIDLLVEYKEKSTPSTASSDDGTIIDTPKPTVKRSKLGKGTKPTRKAINSSSTATSTATTRPNVIVISDKTTPKPGHRSSNGTSDGIALDLQELGLDNKEISSSLIEKKDKIGSGGFKDVYAGTIRKKRCAVADIRGQLTEMDIKELQVLSKLNHPNIVKFLGVSIPEDKSVPVMLISELCKNGDLFDYLRQHPPPTNKKAFQIMLDIAKGLEYLHNAKPSIIHRDVKSSNVLIDDRGRAKLNDFGLARVKQSTRSMIQSLVGTVNWQAPELWSAKPSYTSSVDISNYHAQVAAALWDKNTKGSHTLRPSLNHFRRQWGGEILNLIERMWAQDGKHRPSAGQVVDELETIIKNIA
ncbi:hypothetical protein E3Q23_03165 [Wallemia mellicola]|uniref:Kinase-like protein n=1 Tax=Wallemia mellicola TaxID=1708541 RepID=A0A4T0LT17_9BASI|nr:hypothetical protein E3Q23_03165 [Wallemia mellicola]TIC63663.1 kinase-like protein [Wallemia mellicola]